jgi:hypothetical protein
LTIKVDSNTSAATLVERSRCSILHGSPLKGPNTIYNLARLGVK